MMLQKNRIYGLMAGITLGFALWGAKSRVKLAPTLPAAASSTESGIPVKADSLTGRNSSTGGFESQAVPEELKNLHAQAAVLMDADSGRILFGKNETEFRPMASTTKIMTCILALETTDPDTICTVSSAAMSQPKVRLGAAKGKEFYLEDLLYSLMLESHNDSAVMIAEAAGGSINGFSQMMNSKARQIGCMNTCFLTPNGLDAQKTLPDGTVKTHGTTAADLARMMRYCVAESPKKEEFLKITRTSNYSFTDRTGNSSYSCVNHNALLSMVNGVISGKTGFTGGAGYSYVAAYENDGRLFIIALLGCGWPPHKNYKWADARALFSYGRENYFYRDVYREPEPELIQAEEGIEESVLAVSRLPEEKRHFELLLSSEDQVDIQEDVPNALPAPISADKPIGWVNYRLNGEIIRRDPLYAEHEVKKWSLGYCLPQVLSRFLILPTDSQSYYSRPSQGCAVIVTNLAN